VAARAGRERQAEVLAGAVPFLHLLGTVCGSCRWDAQRSPRSAAWGCWGCWGDGDYLSGIVELARFYFAHLAPQVAALARIVTQGGASVVESGEAIFG